jgi:isopenicillin-N epimerase
MREHFLLNPDITFFNFGSFGACVKPVLEKYHALQYEQELDSVDFIVSKGLQYLKEAREALGLYIGCHANDVVFVTNPSYAVNAVAKSLLLKLGDEVLTTDIEYGACDKTWDYYCEKAGAKYIQRAVKLPLLREDEMVEDFLKGITANTKLIFISHITSSTALRLPVEKICAAAKKLGIATFVDGAHAPAHINIDLQNSPFDFYTGACHKWMLTPKGSSFMYVSKEKQHLVDPLIVSWGYKALFPSESKFLDYHQMNGTRDYTAFLTLPTAIDFMKENNWWAVSNSCKQLVKENRAELCKILGTEPIAMPEGEFALQMFATEVKTTEPEKLHDYLYNMHKIQIPVMRLREKAFMRFSINAFNSQADLDKLFAALAQIKTNTMLIA